MGATVGSGVAVGGVVGIDVLVGTEVAVGCGVGVGSSPVQASAIEAREIATTIRPTKDESLILKRFLA